MIGYPGSTSGAAPCCCSAPQARKIALAIPTLQNRRRLQCRNCCITCSGQFLQRHDIRKPCSYLGGQVVHPRTGALKKTLLVSVWTQ